MSNCERVVEAGSAGEADDTVVEVFADVDDTAAIEVVVEAGNASVALSAVLKSEVLPHPAPALSSPHPMSPPPKGAMFHLAAALSSPQTVSPPPDEVSFHPAVVPFVSHPPDDP